MKMQLLSSISHPLLADDTTKIRKPKKAAEYETIIISLLYPTIRRGRAHSRTQRCPPAQHGRKEIPEVRLRSKPM